jgi:hypothetical protein
MKLRYDEAFKFAQDLAEYGDLLCHDFGGFVVGVDWKSIEQWPIDELWTEFMVLMGAK